MTGVRIVAVDERDSSWEDVRPRFRVYLHSSGPHSTCGSTWTYDVTGADVLQVIDWAQKRAAPDRTYAVALVLDRALLPGEEAERGLVWLVGLDGNTNAWDEAEADMLQRMLRRREQPVVVPPADAVPSDVVVD